jgi:hypothetical protein
MKRPRSAVTSGRKQFVEGNPNSAWSRRYFDLCAHHIHDISCGEGRDAITRKPRDVQTLDEYLAALPKEAE